jgi:hypothetical protein
MSVWNSEDFTTSCKIFSAEVDEAPQISAGPMSHLLSSRWGVPGAASFADDFHGLRWRAGTDHSAEYGYMTNQMSKSATYLEPLNVRRAISSSDSRVLNVTTYWLNQSGNLVIHCCELCTYRSTDSSPTRFRSTFKVFVGSRHGGNALRFVWSDS